MPRPHRPSINGVHVKQETGEERKSRLRKEAEERQAAWAAMSPTAQESLLLRRPGESQKQLTRMGRYE